MAAYLDAQVEAFRNRPLDAGPYTFLWCDALTIKVREAGRTVNVHALIAVGVNGDGGREVLGLDVAATEDGAGWLAFLRSLTARGLSGVRLVVSDAHRGLVDAIGATLPGVSWQRCRTHYLRNLLTKVPKAAQPWVATMVRTIFDQPDADSAGEQFTRAVDTIAARFADAATHLDDARDDLLAFSAFPHEIWRQIWSNNPQERLNKEIRRRTTWSGSSPTVQRSSGSSAPCWPSRPTNGPSNAATWAWRSSAKPDSHSSPPTPTRPAQRPNPIQPGSPRNINRDLHGDRLLHHSRGRGPAAPALQGSMGARTRPKRLRLLGGRAADHDHQLIAALAGAVDNLSR